MSLTRGHISPDAFQHPRALIVLLELLFLIGPCHSSSGLVIQKCCKDGEILTLQMECVRDEDANTAITDEFHWFPMSGLVDMSPGSRLQQNYFSVLKNATVLKNARPMCTEKEHEIMAYSEARPQFHFLLLNETEMRIYISAAKTLHDPLNHRHARNLSYQETYRSFPMQDVCVDAVRGRHYHAIDLCPCKTVTCIRKCCSHGDYYNDKVNGCAPMKESEITNRWRPLYIEVYQYLQFHFYR